MDHQLSIVARQQLDRFCRQYLQILLELDYPTPEHLRQDALQQALYARLFKEGALDHEPPQRYQLRVLKEIIKRIEESIQDWEEEGISDNLMNHFSTLLSSSLPSEATSVQTKSYVTYSLSSLPPKNSSTKNPTITLLEARNLLAASGTTGLRTWEAAIHLGNYLCSNPSLIQGKSVLELGAGTGYISVLCAAHLGATHTLATDGSDDVVASLSANFFLNALESSSLICAMSLTWGHALVGGETPQWNDGRKIDIVLGADLTYDGSGIPALVATFNDLCEFNAEVRIIYAGTVRNEKTFGVFLETVRRNGLSVEEIEYPVQRKASQEGPFYEDKVPIQLCLITRKKKGGR